jgi:hypothetical protein
VRGMVGFIRRRAAPGAEKGGGPRRFHPEVLPDRLAVPVTPTGYPCRSLARATTSSLPSLTRYGPVTAFFGLA